MQNFIREHPNLGQLSVESETRIQHDPNADGKLFKLKDLFWHLLFETYTRGNNKLVLSFTFTFTKSFSVQYRNGGVSC